MRHDFFHLHQWVKNFAEVLMAWSYFVSLFSSAVEPIWTSIGGIALLRTWGLADSISSHPFSISPHPHPTNGSIIRILEGFSSYLRFAILSFQKAYFSVFFFWAFLYFARCMISSVKTLAAHLTAPGARCLLFSKKFCF